MAPPRTKRPGQSSANMSQTSSPYVAKDPIYANSKQLDAWHGAPGVDLDTVAASIGRSQGIHPTKFFKLDCESIFLTQKLLPKSQHLSQKHLKSCRPELQTSGRSYPHEAKLTQAGCTLVQNLNIQVNIFTNQNIIETFVGLFIR